MRRNALWIVLVLLTVGCVHRRASEEHLVSAIETHESEQRSEVATERVQEGPSETIRMTGTWALEDGGSETPIRYPPASTSTPPGVALPPRLPPGVLFSGTIEVERHGPRLEEREKTVTSTREFAAKAQEEKQTATATETTAGPPGWVWAVPWVVGGLVVLALGYAVARRLLGKAKP